MPSGTTCERFIGKEASARKPLPWPGCVPRTRFSEKHPILPDRGPPRCLPYPDRPQFVCSHLSEAHSIFEIPRVCGSGCRGCSLFAQSLAAPQGVPRHGAAALVQATAPAAPKPEDTEVWEPVPKVVTPGAAGMAPSPDAIALFDGKNLDEWVSTRDKIAGQMDRCRWRADRRQAAVAMEFTGRMSMET